MLYILTAIMAMFPFVEGKTTLPIAIFVFRLNPTVCFVLILIVNLIPALYLLNHANDIIEFMKKRRKFRRASVRLRMLIRKNSRKVASYHTKPGIIANDYTKLMGLFLFVLIPAPLTGVWGGGFVASFLKLDKVKSFIAISLANIISITLLFTAMDIVVKVV